MQRMRKAPATRIDAFVSPSIPASTSFKPQVARVGERSNSANKVGDRALPSFWIQRLKAQGEPERFKRETFASDTETLQGSHLQEAPFTKTWENMSLSKVEQLDEERVLKDSLNEQISSSEHQDYGGGERQNNFFKQGQGRIVPLATPYTSEFGHQIYQIAERKLPTKLMTADMSVNSRYKPEAWIPAVESKSHASHAVRVQAVEGGIPSSSLGKPPLPPSHNKSGFTPRPAGHKSPSFSVRSSAGKFCSSPPNNKLAAIPSQDIVRQPSHIAFMKESLSVTDGSAGPLSKEGGQGKDGMSCQDPLAKEKVVLSVEPLTRHLPVSYSEGKSSLTHEPPKKIARQDFEAMDMIALGTESLKNLKDLETCDQASSTLLKESSMRKPPPECSVRSSQADEIMEAAPSASTTASFPWEMFAAGPSKSAREEFVEVYNQARNELKNYKSSSSITKVENCPGFASEHAKFIQDTSIIEREGQTSDPEIPEKLSKIEGVDYVSQPGEAKVTVINAHVSQRELFSEKHNCVRFLEGEVDINPGKTSQAFDSVYVTCGKESGLFMQGQSGGPHGCVEPPAVGHKDCSLTVEKSSRCRQGFANSTTPGQTSSTHREFLQPTLEDETDGVSHDKSERHPRMFDKSPVNKKETLMVLSKRQLESPKESLQRERLPRKSDIWLQRWYPPYITSMKVPKNPESDRQVQDLAGGSAGNVRKANESNEHGACAKEDLEKRLIEKGILFQRIMPGAEPEHLKTSSEKVFPSAAAMAIVGTAARRFCTVQPQHKGSFAFWSGFGVPAPQTAKHFDEKGTGKLFFEADPSPQP